MATTCSICGGTRFVANKVLWPELISEWELAPQEVEYVDRQQGTKCAECGANLRIIVLGSVVQELLAPGDPRPLRETARNHHRYSTGLMPSRILDINGADAISEALQPIAGYERRDYPEIDMQAMSLPSDTYDIVLHSDTLEHVPDPIAALRECHRILAPGGTLCFTIPMIVGRLTRTRAGLPPSYHGAPGRDADDWRVQTEFGADAWTWLIRAGFTNAGIRSLDFPAAHALIGRRGYR